MEHTKSTTMCNVSMKILIYHVHSFVSHPDYLLDVLYQFCLDRSVDTSLSNRWFGRIPEKSAAAPPTALRQLGLKTAQPITLCATTVQRKFTSVLLFPWLLLFLLLRLFCCLLKPKECLQQASRG